VREVFQTGDDSIFADGTPDWALCRYMQRRVDNQLGVITIHSCSTATARSAAAALLLVYYYIIM